jgi:hypothetical protein
MNAVLQELSAPDLPSMRADRERRVEEGGGNEDKADISHAAA